MVSIGQEGEGGESGGEDGGDPKGPDPLSEVRTRLLVFVAVAVAVAVCVVLVLVTAVLGVGVGGDVCYRGGVLAVAVAAVFTAASIMSSLCGWWSVFGRGSSQSCLLFSDELRGI